MAFIKLLITITARVINDITPMFWYAKCRLSCKPTAKKKKAKKKTRKGTRACYAKYKELAEKN
jgi:hypothetical protein